MRRLRVMIPFNAESATRKCTDDERDEFPEHDRDWWYRCSSSDDPSIECWSLICSLIMISTAEQHFTLKFMDTREHDITRWSLRITITAKSWSMCSPYALKKNCKFMNSKFIGDLNHIPTTFQSIVRISRSDCQVTLLYFTMGIRRRTRFLSMLIFLYVYRPTLYHFDFPPPRSHTCIHFILTRHHIRRLYAFKSVTSYEQYLIRVSHC